MKFKGKQTGVILVKKNCSFWKVSEIKLQGRIFWFSGDTNVV